MWGRKRVNSSYFRRSREIDALMVKNLRQNEEIVQDLERQHPNKVQISRYLRKEGFPIYNNTHATYFGLGEKVLEAMLEDLKQAKKFILWNILSSQTEKSGIRYSGGTDTKGQRRRGSQAIV